MATRRFTRMTDEISTYTHIRAEAPKGALASSSSSKTPYTAQMGFMNAEVGFTIGKANAAKSPTVCRTGCDDVYAPTEAP
eukprot:scaffold22381_cov118-Isochrysis_galbana.AAC.3